MSDPINLTPNTNDDSTSPEVEMTEVPQVAPPSSQPLPADTTLTPPSAEVNPTSVAPPLPEPLPVSDDPTVPKPKTLGDMISAQQEDTQDRLDESLGIVEDPEPLIQHAEPVAYKPEFVAPEVVDVPPASAPVSESNPTPEVALASEEITPIVEIPVAPDEEKLQTKSRVLHVVLSLLMVLLVIAGAAFAAYWYSQSGSTAIRLPNLPFVEEPQSDVERAQTGQEDIVPAPSPLPEDTIAPPISAPAPVIPPSEPTTKGGVPLDTSTWKTYASSSWAYSFRYPSDWFLYSRDTGSLGELTMVTSTPLSSLDNDMRTLSVQAKEVVIGVGVLTQDKPATTTLLEFVSQNSSLYGLSTPEEATVGGVSVVRALSTQGDVLFYYMDAGGASTSVTVIAVKPSNYDDSYADTIETLITNVSAAL